MIVILYIDINSLFKHIWIFTRGRGYTAGYDFILIVSIVHSLATEADFEVSFTDRVQFINPITACTSFGMCEFSPQLPIHAIYSCGYV